MKTKSIVVGIYAALVFLGGIMGYLIAGSLMSIIMSGVFALLLFICTFLIWNGNQTAYDIALGLLLCLLVFFCYRFLQSYKMMPAGMMTLLTAIVLSYLAVVRKCLCSA